MCSTVCPERCQKKLSAVDHLKPQMAEGEVLFGATMLGRGLAPKAARALLDFYNEKRVLINGQDDLDSLARGLNQRFADIMKQTKGCVAVFTAW